VFEGGMGGEHKLLRGFDPVLVYTAHSYIDERFDQAIRAYAHREAEAHQRELEAWRDRNTR